MIGNYGNGNTGDDAILLQVAPPALQRGKVTVLSRNPERIARLVPEINSVAMVSLRAFGEFLRADTVVIGGGGMFGRGIPLSGRLSSVRPAGGRVHGQGRRALLGRRLSGHAGRGGLGSAPGGSKGA